MEGPTCGRRGVRLGCLVGRDASSALTVSVSGERRGRAAVLEPADASQPLVKGPNGPHVSGVVSPVCGASVVQVAVVAAEFRCVGLKVDEPWISLLASSQVQRVLEVQVAFGRRKGVQRDDACHTAKITIDKDGIEAPGTVAAGHHRSGERTGALVASEGTRHGGTDCWSSAAAGAAAGVSSGAAGVSSGAAGVSSGAAGVSSGAAGVSSGAAGAPRPTA